MTTGDLGRGLGDAALAGQLDTSAAQPGTTPTPPISAQEIVALVDRLVSEPGRRRHLFGWLKAPGAGSEDWLAVDAYYPGQRLVVVCQGPAPQHQAVFRELVPAHGLRLLEVQLPELGSDRSGARDFLQGRLAELGPAPTQVAPTTASSAPASSTPVTPRGAATLPDTHRGSRGARRVTESEAAGVLAGMALIAALVIEIYFGVASAGFGSGNLLLAFALALDACARVLGTVEAWRAREPEWAWLCALGGSPVAVGYALMRSSGPVKTEPAPLAGVIGLGALALLVLAALVGAAGG